VSKLKDRRQEVTGLSYEETQKQIKDLRLRQFNLRLQKQRGEVKDNRVFAQTRKDIARLLHHLTELENEQL
jgi:ribosomal protein L29